MLVNAYPAEDVFARVPELADQTDPVLVQLDRLLDDDLLFAQVRADLVRRYRLTAVHGRHSTPAEAILRLLVVKHLYAWSYQETEERVADSLVLRWFTRVYFRRVPHATTLLRWAQTIQSETLHQLTDRTAQLAAQARVTRARKLRVDGTVVETTIHHPTDSGLLGDGVRVLTRLITRAQPLVGAALAGIRDAFRDRTRTMRRTLRALHRLVRQKGEAVEAEQRQCYARLIQATEQTLKQAQQVRQALAVQLRRKQPKERERIRAQRLHQALERFLPLVAQVIRQTRTRVLEGGKVPAQEKIVSLFEPHTRILQRRKTGVPIEFGRHLVLDEVEGGIVTRSQILAAGVGEQAELEAAVAHHRQVFGHPPELVAADRGFHAPQREARLQAAGVKHAVIPWKGPASSERRALEHSRAWRRHYRWRAGIEGRIHSLRRDYGLKRCRDHGEAGMERCVGWGIVASNLWHIGQACARRSTQAA
ncbi:MAG: ISNCY family transposase [Terriglobales bacterium]